MEGNVGTAISVNKDAITEDTVDMDATTADTVDMDATTADTVDMDASTADNPPKILFKPCKDVLQKVLKKLPQKLIMKNRDVVTTFGRNNEADVLLYDESASKKFMELYMVVNQNSLLEFKIRNVSEKKAICINNNVLVSGQETLVPYNQWSELKLASFAFFICAIPGDHGSSNYIVEFDLDNESNNATNNTLYKTTLPNLPTKYVASGHPVNVVVQNTPNYGLQPNYLPYQGVAPGLPLTSYGVPINNGYGFQGWPAASPQGQHPGLPVLSQGASMPSYYTMPPGVPPPYSPLSNSLDQQRMQQLMRGDMVNPDQQKIKHTGHTPIENCDNLPIEESSQMSQPDDEKDVSRGHQEDGKNPDYHTPVEESSKL